MITDPSPALVAAADLIGAPTPLEELGAAVGRLRRARAAGDDLVAAREWAVVVRLRREVAAARVSS